MMTEAVTTTCHAWQKSVTKSLNSNSDEEDGNAEDDDEEDDYKTSNKK